MERHILSLGASCTTWRERERKREVGQRAQDNGWRPACQVGHLLYCFAMHTGNSLHVAWSNAKIPVTCCMGKRMPCQKKNPPTLGVWVSRYLVFDISYSDMHMLARIGGSVRGRRGGAPTDFHRPHRDRRVITGSGGLVGV